MKQKLDLNRIIEQLNYATDILECEDCKLCFRHLVGEKKFDKVVKKKKGATS